MSLIAPGAKVPPPQQPIDLADQLEHIKNLLSAPISTLVDDSSEMQKVLEQIESQLLESLRVKLWPAGHLPFFRAEVKAAQQRIELRLSQIPLKANIAEKVQDAKPEEGNSGCQSRYLSEYKGDSASWRTNWQNSKKKSAPHRN